MCPQEVATNPGFNECREVIDFLVSEIRDIEPRLERYSAMGLPTQARIGLFFFQFYLIAPKPCVDRGGVRIATLSRAWSVSLPWACLPG